MNNKIFGIVYCSYVQGNMFSACNRSLCGHQAAAQCRSAHCMYEYASISCVNSKFFVLLLPHRGDIRCTVL